MTPGGFFKRKRMSPISGANIAKVNYKNPDLLLKGISPETGKILPSRILGTNRQEQKILAREIKRARFLGLLPYNGDHSS